VTQPGSIAADAHPGVARWPGRGGDVHDAAALCTPGWVVEAAALDGTEGAEATHIRVCCAPPRGRRWAGTAVRINRLAEEPFYAEVVLDSTIGTRTIDARPSDAIALALVTRAPIRVAAEVMEQAGRTPEELSQSRPAESRSARERADQIREVVAMPKGRWTSTMVF
jgi:hypothetical protein